MNLQRGFVTVQSGGRLQVRVDASPAALQPTEWQSIPRALQQNRSTTAAGRSSAGPGCGFPAPLSRVPCTPPRSLSLSAATGGAPPWFPAAESGWFPLGPREPYVPPYTVSNVYVRNINISHVTVVNVRTINVVNYRYVNRGVPGAMTAIPQPGLRSGATGSGIRVYRSP